MREKFLALPESAQKDILDKHRDAHNDYEWWEGVYTNFKEDMANIGISVNQMFFSGFWGQGDGACFEGCISNWTKFLPTLTGYSCFLHKDIYDTLIFGVKHRGYYYHSNSTAYSSDFDYVNPYEENTIRWYAMEALIKECNEKLDDFWGACEEAFKDHMDDLYKQLEKEHDYLTSDEYILKRLIDTDELEEEINEYIESTAESTEDYMAPA